jgi:hypothetical protein
MKFDVDYNVESGPRELRRLKLLAIVMPVLVSISVIVSIALNNFAARRVGGGLILVIASVFLGRFVVRIAKGYEAKFVNVRVRPDDDESKKAMLMWTAIFVQALFVVAPYTR